MQTYKFHSLTLKDSYKLRKVIFSRYSVQASSLHDLRQGAELAADPYDLQQWNSHAQCHQCHHGEWMYTVCKV